MVADPHSWCILALLVLIGIVLLGRIILKIALWIIIILVVLIVIGGGVALIFNILSFLSIMQVIPQLTAIF